MLDDDVGRWQLAQALPHQHPVAGRLPAREEPLDEGVARGEAPIAVGEHENGGAPHDSIRASRSAPFSRIGSSAQVESRHCCSGRCRSRTQKRVRGSVPIQRASQ